MNFLIVDDFSTMRRIIINLLKELGCENFFEAENGEEALKVIQKEHIDFVVTDWNMPKMDGLTLLQTIRKNAEIAHLPVLMVTAEAKKENIIAAAQAGASSYIVKPFTAVTLGDKINQILSKKGLPHLERKKESAST